jgi:hypothetical protein
LGGIRTQRRSHRAALIGSAISSGERFEKMKIFSWNVNGIRAVIKKGVFQPFLEKFRPDIVCLQETKAERGQFEIDLPDYREFLEARAAVRHQRLSPRVCKALLVRR